MRITRYVLATAFISFAKSTQAEEAPLGSMKPVARTEEAPLGTLKPIARPRNYPIHGARAESVLGTGGSTVTNPVPTTIQNPPVREGVVSDATPSPQSTAVNKAVVGSGESAAGGSATTTGPSSTTESKATPSSSTDNVFDQVAGFLAVPSTTGTTASNDTQLENVLADFGKVISHGSAPPRHMISPLAALVAFGIGLWVIF